MVHGITFSSSDVLASLALEFDVGDWSSIDNAFKPMKSLYHISIFEKNGFFFGRAAQTFDENFSPRKRRRYS